jgi:hypothetical protein
LSLALFAIFTLKCTKIALFSWLTLNPIKSMTYKSNCGFQSHPVAETQPNSYLWILSLINSSIGARYASQNRKK